MHPSAIDFGRRFFETYCVDLNGATVIDIGAQNINGSLKDVCPTTLKYIGLDFVPGNGVDIVLDNPYNLPLSDQSIDVVVCSSVFEHSQFFWLLFLEIMRVLKPHGLFYLNVPSNGYIHRYPVDCWRFYPDSASALVAWGARNGYATALLESFVANKSDLTKPEGLWNDFIAVFVRDEKFGGHYTRRICETTDQYQNLNSAGIAVAENSNFYPQDLLILNERDQQIAERDRIIAELRAQLVQANSAAKTNQQACSCPSMHTIESGANNRSACLIELEEDRCAYERADHLLESGQGKEGTALLEALAEKGSSCWEVYNDLAVLYLNEGDNLRATPYFQKGMELEGKSGTTARNFATMLLMTGDMEGALAILGMILRERPHDSGALAVIGDILSTLNPVSPDAWLKLVSDLRDEPWLDGAECSVEPRRQQQTRPKLESPNSSDIKIFQIFYDESTRAKVDSNFIPLDNSENLRPDWCEYWPIRNVLLNHSFEDDTYLGFFSPRFFEKTGMDGNAVLEKVRYSNDEVISFSPYFDQAALHTNSFVQGEFYHPGLIEVTQSVLSLLNVPLKLDSLICDQTTIIFSNYFVARYSFWKKWFAYAEKIFAVCEGPDCELKASLVKATTHRKGAEYAMKVFVLERLVTIVMEELGINSRVGIDIRKAPLLLPGSKENFAGLVICDALKGQYRKTGLPVYKDVFFNFRGGDCH